MYLPLDDGTRYELSRTQNDHVEIFPRQTTPLHLPLNIEISQPLENKAVQKILGACGIPSSDTVAQLNLQYEVFASILVLNNIKIKEGTFAFDCKNNNIAKTASQIIQGVKPVIDSIPGPLVDQVKSTVENNPELGNQVLDGAGSILGVKTTDLKSLIGLK